MKKNYAVAFIFICLFSTAVYADNICVSIDNKNIEFSDAAPQIIDGRTMAPIRSVLGHFCCSEKFNLKSVSVN